MTEYLQFFLPTDDLHNAQIKANGNLPNGGTATVCARYQPSHEVKTCNC